MPAVSEICLSNEVIEYFKKDGKGRQTRINDLLVGKLKQD
ncbi:MAG: BrnA antitoxin family protein [Proteobacteria bacterium]|nr:BrnA antitoxin family protein [Pseudomonadota bacterium]